MYAYSINYTLHNKSTEDYERLATAIIKASSGTYMQCTNSFWIITSESSSSEIYTIITQAIASNDNIIVLELCNSYACQLPRKQVEWLEKVLG